MLIASIAIWLSSVKDGPRGRLTRIIQILLGLIQEAIATRELKHYNYVKIILFHQLNMESRLMKLQ